MGLMVERRSPLLVGWIFPPLPADRKARCARCLLSDTCSQVSDARRGYGSEPSFASHRCHTAPAPGAGPDLHAADSCGDRDLVLARSLEASADFRRIPPRRYIQGEFLAAGSTDLWERFGTFLHHLLSCESASARKKMHRHSADCAAPAAHGDVPTAPSANLLCAAHSLSA